MSYAPKPPPDLEELIRHKQDELRGRPESWEEIIVDNFTVIDWWAVATWWALLLWMLI